jgi:hypothetical protein
MTMTEPVPQPSQYVISGKAEQGFVQQTRGRAASAIVLARRWIDSGYSDVRVLDPAGSPLSPERYRLATLSSGRFFR